MNCLNSTNAKEIGTIFLNLLVFVDWIPTALSAMVHTTSFTRFLTLSLKIINFKYE